MRREFRQPSRRDQLDFDPVISPITFLILWRIPDHVAISQLDSDFLRDIGQFDPVPIEHVRAARLGDPRHPSQTGDRVGVVPPPIATV